MSSGSVPSVWASGGSAYASAETSNSPPATDSGMGNATSLLAASSGTKRGGAGAIRAIPGGDSSEEECCLPQRRATESDGAGRARSRSFGSGPRGSRTGSARQPNAGRFSEPISQAIALPGGASSCLGWRDHPAVHRWWIEGSPLHPDHARRPERSARPPTLSELDPPGSRSDRGPAAAAAPCAGAPTLHRPICDVRVAQGRGAAKKARALRQKPWTRRHAGAQWSVSDEGEPARRAESGAPATAWRPDATRRQKRERPLRGCWGRRRWRAGVRRVSTAADGESGRWSTTSPDPERRRDHDARVDSPHPWTRWTLPRDAELASAARALMSRDLRVLTEGRSDRRSIRPLTGSGSDHRSVRSRSRR